MEIRRTKIVGFTLLLAGLALCGTGLWMLLSPAQYRATARINVDPFIDYHGGQESYDPYFIQTEFEIIQSPLVLSNVVESLALNVEWGKKYGDGSPFKTTRTVVLLKRRMNLNPVRNTRLIEISFTSEDPDEAAKIANAIAKAYTDFREKKRQELTERGVRELTENFQREEHTIKIQEDNVERIKTQLNVPNPEPPDELLKSNFPSYFQEKQKLQNLLELHKVITARMKAEELNKLVIADRAAPKSPVGPNRFLGAFSLIFGFIALFGGGLLFKSSRLQSV